MKTENFAKTSHLFTKHELVRILDACLNKTLGEVDINHVFDKTKTSPKIKGIAGDVIEQSVLGYPADNRQEPDLVVDGEYVELKTTGIEYEKKGQPFTYKAKEPMSITAVSPHMIVFEEFEDSNFWHKLAKMLIVYYLYNSKQKVCAADYAHFPIKGYQFHEFSEEDIAILKREWSLVRDFIRSLQRDYEDYESQYPRLSSELRRDLFYIDTAPKWPNPPRFRLKRSVVTTIVQKHFGARFDQLPHSYSTFSEIEAECNRNAKKYYNKTIDEIATRFGFHQEKYHKSIAERIVVNMFGGKAKKMHEIELFSKIGILGKNVILSPKGEHTEDMKLFPIDFDEIQDLNVTFEESSFYNFFASHQFLYIIFKEDVKGSPVGETRFQGFKRYQFTEKLIHEYVRPVWERVRHLVVNKELIDVIEYNKDGTPRINKTGVIKSAPNFPKKSNGPIFVRGSGQDSRKKTFELNGIKMYVQWLWISGAQIDKILDGEKFI